MANENKKAIVADEESLEELQREIAKVELQTKRLQLNAARKQNEAFEVAEKRRHEANRKRMAELIEGRRNKRAIQLQCRHKSGGTPQNILRGGGIGAFSLLSRTIMPDGVTVLIQCQRCRLMEYPPSQKLKEEDPQAYKEQLEYFNKLLEDSTENGLQHVEMRGPTFMFKNSDGVPIIPERV